MQHLALRPNTRCHRLWLEVWHDMSLVKTMEKQNKTKQKKSPQQCNKLCRRCIPAFSKPTWNVMLIPNPHAGFPHRTHHSVTHRQSAGQMSRHGPTHASVEDPQSDKCRHKLVNSADRSESIYIPHMQVDVPQTASPHPHPPRLFGL